ncbi:hypothetical protein PILCRDRAFT_810495 [Piloderma croceum F 1598]|uniref:Uncharacterized protein n=1 Tax=Piloderma croceum (strain F 1598) TaxID=765440 RepID=A0A0C3GLI1_PILCF|nr:hypothetical protein PILCRDRAFT_810495 [Piloderma croceum F 1598]
MPSHHASNYPSRPTSSGTMLKRTLSTLQNNPYGPQPHPSAILPHSFSAKMCYRQVQCALHSICGHQEPRAHSTVDCQNSRCRYSSLHPQNCGGCPQSCRQWLDNARNIVTQTVNSRCYHCSR